MHIVIRELEKLDIRRYQNCRIGLMGRLEHVRIMAGYLKEQGINTAAILDNDKNKHGTFSDGIPIVSPESFAGERGMNDRVLIYSPKYWEEMKDQLVLAGYKDRTELIVLDRPSVKNNIRMVGKGFSVYRNIRRRFGPDVQIFLANCPLGDYYLLGLFLNKYCRKNEIDNYVVVGESEGISKLSELFGIKQTQKLDNEESNALIRAWIFAGDRIKMKPLTLWQGAFRFNPPVARQKAGFSFTDTFRYLIFGLPVGNAPEFPANKGDKEAIRKVFRDKNLIEGHTVLLSPYAYSMPGLPAGFWRDLTKGLKDKGYTVAINIGEERESNIVPEAAAVTLDFRQIMEFMECAGLVIGMRSGFFDITSRTDCKKIILYPKATHDVVEWNSNSIDFCSLKNMGLCADAVELEVPDPGEALNMVLHEVTANDRSGT